MRVVAKSCARCVALLGIVVWATTFVALLAIITILSTMRLMEDLISVSLNCVDGLPGQYLITPVCLEEVLAPLG